MSYKTHICCYTTPLMYFFALRGIRLSQLKLFHFEFILHLFWKFSRKFLRNITNKGTGNFSCVPENLSFIKWYVSFDGSILRRLLPIVTTQALRNVNRTSFKMDETNLKITYHKTFSQMITQNIKYKEWESVRSEEISQASKGNKMKDVICLIEGVSIDH
ncbi:hypothetical protein GQX74_010000 [Glossina fuscipes]|nr:hypothetical protein GQX74_010000 [Glossina fuscipes]